MTCSECARRLPSDAFYASNRSKCRECVKEASRKRRQENPEAHREATRRWRVREELRAALLEHVLQILAARYQRAFFEAVMDAEDSLGMEPGSALELFSRKNHVSSSQVKRTNTERDQDVA